MSAGAKWQLLAEYGQSRNGRYVQCQRWHDGSNLYERVFDGDVKWYIKVSAGWVECDNMDQFARP